MDPGTILVAAVAVGGIGLLTSLRILFEYERGVIFRLGKLTRAKGPGLIFLVPFGIERLRKMDLRIVALDIAPQDTASSEMSVARSHSLRVSRVSCQPHFDSDAFLKPIIAGI
jgi:regulator of protease activity HflC (stomatin/prohibitin superfamily)